MECLAGSLDDADIRRKRPPGVSRALSLHCHFRSATMSPLSNAFLANSSHVCLGCRVCHFSHFYSHFIWNRAHGSQVVSRISTFHLSIVVVGILEVVVLVLIVVVVE